MKDENSNGIWRFTSTKKNLPDLLIELHEKSIIFPFELDQLQLQVASLSMQSSDNLPCFISGLYKDVVFLPSEDNLDSFDILVNRNTEKLDLITLLPSKFALQRQVENWLTDEQKNSIIALFIIELDEFSKINDVMDHTAGDIILYQVARRLEQMPERTFKVVRLHGDEFAIAVKGFETLEQIWQTAGWIEKQFQDPFIFDNTPIFIRPSVGISSIPHIAPNYAELVRTAYLALNKAKDDVTQISQFYESKHANELIQQLKIKTELSSALQMGKGIEVFYQPKLSLSSNKIEGVEALVRWRQPSRELVSPGQFIPVAEKSELICSLTDYVINQVCKDIAVFKQHGYFHQVSINISARDFARKDFITDICRIITQNKVNPRDIELEITEGAFISDFTHCCVVLNALREFGFSISIDDFGTGYSSLSYLRRLPIDVLKVDMSFINDIEKSTKIRKIYAALIDIADALDLKVVAEGVENAAQQNVLTSIGCDLIQGYLISKPVPLIDFCTSLLKSETN